MPGVLTSAFAGLTLPFAISVALAGEPVEVQRQQGIPPGLSGNNPLNLMYVGQSDAIGYVPLQNGRRVAAYENMRSGVAAEIRQLRAYQAAGLLTVRQLATKWVSDPKADLSSYIADVSASIGVSADQPIDLNDPATAAAFVLGAQPHETGRPVSAQRISYVEKFRVVGKDAAPSDKAVAVQPPKEPSVQLRSQIVSIKVEE